MRRMIQIIGMSIAFALPAVAAAQGGGAPIQMHQGQGATFAAGVVRGTVVGLNLANGVIAVRSGGGVTRLNATPAQLAGLNPGDVVRFPYVDYRGHLWLAPGAGAGRAHFFGGYAQQGRYTGAVQELRRGRGAIALDGRRFRIHPAQLQGIVPGELVSVRYIVVGNVGWVTGIRPAGTHGHGFV